MERGVDGTSFFTPCSGRRGILGGCGLEPARRRAGDVSLEEVGLAMRTLLRARAVLPVVLIAGLGIVWVKSSLHSGAKPARPVVHEDTEATRVVEAIPKQTARLEASGAAARQLPPAPAPIREEPPAAVAAPDVAALRRPLIGAIRGDFATPAERRAAMRAALEDSGPTGEPWSLLAGRVFDDWRDALPMKLSAKTKLSTPQCFRAGCMTSVSFQDRETYEAAARTLRELPGEDARHGGRMQSPPEIAPDGQITALWMMFRPEDDSGRGGGAPG
jgi:hypothetical protein